MSCSGFCHLMSTEYELQGSELPFADPTTFLKWFVAWASNMDQEFRMKCLGCKDGEIEYLACDGTKIGMHAYVKYNAIFLYSVMSNKPTLVVRQTTLIYKGQDMQDKFYLFLN